MGFCWRQPELLQSKTNKMVFSVMGSICTGWLDWLTDWLTFIHSFIHSCMPSLISQSVSQSVIHSFIHSFIQAINHSFNRLFIQSFNRSFIQSISHSINQSIIQSISLSLIHKFTNQEVNRQKAYIPKTQHPACDWRFFVGIINFLYDMHPLLSIIYQLVQ